MGTIYRPTSEEKLKGLDNTFYEMQQLLLMTVSQVEHAVLANAIVESRLIHVRTLLDFFEKHECDKDDVLASHYGFPSAEIQFEPIFVERLNKDLAHLTYSRTRREASAKGWPTAKVVTPVLGRCKEFIEYILRERSIFGVVGPTDWRALGLGIQQFLESPIARHGA